MPFQRILVPTDFSPASRLAGSWAALLACRLDAQLTLLHCLDMPEHEWYDLEGVSPDIKAIAVKLLASARERLATERAAIPEAEGLEVTLRARSGIPAREILGEVREAPMDLVVVATEGRTGLAHALLGSVTEKLVRTCPCPLLTVKAGESLPTDGLRDVLFPTDFSDASLAALPTAIEMATTFGGALTALHVLEEPTLSVGTVQQVFDITPELLQSRLEDRARRALRSRIEPQLPEGLEFHTRLLGGNAHEEIVREAAGGKHDLVIMGTDGASSFGEALLGSTAERVVRTCTIPVLTVRSV